jgi:hypothetical protein
MLSKHQGTTLDAWAKATGWLSHTTRAALVFGGSLLLFGPKVIEHGDDQIGHDDGEGDFEDEHGRLFLIEALALRYGLVSPCVLIRRLNPRASVQWHWLFLSISLGFRGSARR